MEVPSIALRSDLYVQEEWRIEKPPVNSYMGKVVEYLREERPVYQKIFINSVAFLIAALSIGCLVGIILIPMAYHEYQAQVKSETETDAKMLRILEKRLQLTNADLSVSDAIAQAIGDVTKIPKYDLQMRMGWTDYIDFLNPDELPYSVVQGVDKFGRHFFSLKLLDKETQKKFVVTIFERDYKYVNNWVFGSNYSSVFRDSPMKAQEIVYLYKLCHGRNDLPYRLVS